MIVASKSQGARMKYNTRHHVCLMAAALLAKRLRLDKADHGNGKSIKNLGN